MRLLIQRCNDWKPNCFAISLDFAIRHGVFEVEGKRLGNKMFRLQHNLLSLSEYLILVEENSSSKLLK